MSTMTKGQALPPQSQPPELSVNELLSMSQRLRTKAVGETADLAVPLFNAARNLEYVAGRMKAAQ